MDETPVMCHGYQSCVVETTEMMYSFLVGRLGITYQIMCPGFFFCIFSVRKPLTVCNVGHLRLFQRILSVCYSVTASPAKTVGLIN